MIAAAYLSASSWVSLASRLSAGGDGSTGSSKEGGVCRCSGGGHIKGSVVPLHRSRETHRTEHGGLGWQMASRITNDNHDGGTNAGFVACKNFLQLKGVLVRLLAGSVVAFKCCLYIL